MSRLILIVFVFVGLFFSSCAKKEEAVSTLKEEETGVKQAMEEVYLQETEEGKKRWELWANSVDLFAGKKVFKNVRFKFYRDDGILYLKGDEAEIINESGDIYMRGHVSGKSDEGVELTTDEFFWQAKENRLSTECPVKLMSKTIYIEGVGLETNPKLKEAHLKSNVHVTFFQEITDDVPMIITSHSLNAFFGDNPSAVFDGDVVVRDSQVEVHSSMLIINFNPDGRRVKESIARGGVEIITDEIEAQCGEATFLNDEKKIVLEADPIIWHEKVKCRGNKITYLQGERKVIVQDNIKGVFLPKSIDSIPKKR